MLVAAKFKTRCSLNFYVCLLPNGLRRLTWFLTLLHFITSPLLPPVVLEVFSNSTESVRDTTLSYKTASKKLGEVGLVPTYRRGKEKWQLGERARTSRDNKAQCSVWKQGNWLPVFDVPNINKAMCSIGAQIFRYHGPAFGRLSVTSDVLPRCLGRTFFFALTWVANRIGDRKSSRVQCWYSVQWFDDWKRALS